LLAPLVAWVVWPPQSLLFQLFNLQSVRVLRVLLSRLTSARFSRVK
jgi:hypothetical protein